MDNIKIDRFTGWWLIANDVTIFATIVLILLATGAIIPMIKSDFTDDDTSVNVEGFVDDNLQTAPSMISATSVFWGAIKMLFWNWGDMPFFLDIFFWMIRMVGVFIFVRLLRGTG